MTKRRLLTASIVLFWLVLALVPLMAGWSYYTTPFMQRPYHPLHALFKSTGVVGHGLGVLGTLFIIIGVATYSIRKRYKALRRVSKLRYWLHFHIFLCTLGPFWVLLHSAFRIHGIVAISFWSMATVTASGVFGRYIYARIPKTLNGVFLEDAEIEANYRTLLDTLRDTGGFSTGELKAAGISLSPEREYTTAQALLATMKLDALRLSRHPLEAMLGDRSPDAARKRAIRRLIRELDRTAAQMSMKQPLQKIFGYWHVFHVPLAGVMFAILIVHIAVAVIFGYTWIF